MRAPTTSRSDPIWDDILEFVKQRIPEVEFRTWFTQVQPLGIEDGTFMLGVPHSFAKDWLKNHYSGVIEEALRHFGAPSPRVGFQVIAAKPSEQQDMFNTPPASEEDRAHRQQTEAQP